MRNPTHVLKSLEDKACVKRYTYERLYRNLYNSDFYLLAYKKIATSPGSMTTGADGLSIDQMSMARINRIIESMKDHSYQPNPARRTYIAKKNNPAKKRPLGIPSTDDKLVQEIVRMLLESIYEPTFSNQSHGFRPKRSCHTALAQIQGTFTGVRWIVEGDIKACFDSFDHHVLINLLRRRIKDEAFISLMWKFLKAGYMEQWEYHKTYSGTPQGSGMSPILANIYMTELDTFMEEYKTRFDSEPFKRNASKEYEKIARRFRKAKARLDSGEASPEEIREFKDAQQLKLSTPYADVLDEKFKKIQYNRYADDFVVGVIGSKQDALQIKEDIRRFLAEQLRLTLSDEKTKVTHSSEKVRYLGYDMAVCRSKSTKRDKNGALKRPWYGKVFLYVPHEKWEGKLHEYKAMEVKWDESRGRNFWRPMPRNELMNKQDIEIVSQINSEIRGIYNFYRLAENVGVLSKFYYMMRYSLLKTYAGKYRTIVSKIKRKYMRGGVFRVSYDTKAGPKVCEFYHDGFKKQDYGYDNVQDTLPQFVRYDGRNTLANRLKAGVCEMCGGQTEDIRMHHVRSLKKLTGETASEQLMMKMRRKSLALCSYECTSRCSTSTVGNAFCGQSDISPDCR
ncbi:group II intron reverse transcriptase/maturase [Christensenellaceae bacterium OttesenSCG-928-L17]|nr:group II intron reverse transcriptase/maturase [Christensenellaceae bacterium OttesenSCG-928-L17]